MRIAVLQMPGADLTEWRGTLALLDGLLAQARAAGATLALLPECVWPAYALGSRAMYAAARAAGLPAPQELQAHLAGRARELGLYVCAGYVEEHGDALYNAASLFDPQGRILLTHRKCFLWDFDHDYFTPGNELQVADTPLGRVGILICADARLPEIPATLVARGAQLLLQPTAWVNAGTPATPWNPQPEFVIPSRAAEWGVVLASTSKWGTEGDTTFVGSSLICDASGRTLASCGTRETGIALADGEYGGGRPPIVTGAERALLLAPSPAVPPTDDDAALLLHLAPAGGHDGTASAAGYRGAGATPVLPLCAPGRVADAVAFEPSGGLRLAGAVEGLVSWRGVRVASLLAAELGHFAPARCATLQGAHLLVAYGDDVRTEHVRTRACENRVFVAWLGRTQVRLYDPRGLELARATWPTEGCTPLGGMLPLASAACKEVCAHTDVLRGRRVTQYEF